MLKYSELTDPQKLYICNGCGGKGGLIDPPEFIFNSSCNQHDFYYWRGGSEDDRKNADDSFYNHMMDKVKNTPWYKFYVYKALAWTYYKAVRISGKKFFEYGTMKSLEDLNREMYS